MTKSRHARRATIGAAITALILGWVGSAALAEDTVDMAAAKKEGKVVWYTSTPVKVAQKLAKMFEDESGIKVELFRSGGSAVLSRFMQEHGAGRIAADVLTSSDPAAANDMARKGMCVAFKPKDFDKIPNDAKDPNGYHVAQRLNVITIYAREDKIAAADLPKSWTDLTNPKYKGKMVTTDPSFTSLQRSIVGTLSKKLGWTYYENLRKNDIMIVRGNQQMLNALKSGERLIAAGGLDSYAAGARKEGHKLKSIFPADGAFMIPAPTSVIKGSPHPNAAKALAAFMISKKAQEVFPASGGYSARIDVAPPPGYPKLADLKTIAVDYDDIKKQTGSIKKKFNEVFQ